MTCKHEWMQKEHHVIVKIRINVFTGKPFGKVDSNLSFV